MRQVRIAEQWDIILPDHRADRGSDWDWWERSRLESIHDTIATNYWDLPSWERPVIWDIGAEEGDMAGLFSQWGYHVVCAEPNPRVWPNLKAIWEANDLRPMLAQFVGFIGDTTVEPDEPLEGTGWFHKGWFHNGKWPPCADGPLIGDHGFCNLWERPDIPRITLDDAVRMTILPVEAVTMDTEGSEMRILNGMTRILQEYRPVVWVSLHPPEFLKPYGDHPDDLVPFMEQFGYTGRLLDDAHEQHWVFHP